MRILLERSLPFLRSARVDVARGGVADPPTPELTPRSGDRRRVRTIWISDLHLGTRGCQAEMLLDFLAAHECDSLYLVGDIVDGWSLRRSWYWSDAHGRVVQDVVDRTARTDVTYVVGNHDEFLRDYPELRISGVKVKHEEAEHVTADGRRLLILHGDCFDVAIRTAKWLAFLGDRAYQFTLEVNWVLNRVRRALGYPYWSLSAYLKHKVKNAVSYIDSFENAVTDEARRRGFDGVVCGHIHKAEMRMIDGVLYCNDGDWVESCTALVEHVNGRLELVDWSRPDARRATDGARERTAEREAVGAAG